VAFLAGHGAFNPAQALAVGDDADILAFGFQDRTLLDMEFEEGFHWAFADGLRALEADPFQLVAEFQARRIFAVVGPVLVQHPGENAGGEHSGGETGALLVGPVGDHDGVAGLDLALVQGADDLQAAQHAQHAVVFSAGRLGIEMRADIDWQRIRVGALAPGEHGAHLVDAHGQPLGLAPFGEQAPPGGVVIGQGLAVVAAGDAGADLCHLHQAVPQPVAVESEVRAQIHIISRHGILPDCVALTVW
jgi:hypothetical protein